MKRQTSNARSEISSLMSLRPGAPPSSAGDQSHAACISDSQGTSAAFVDRILQVRIRGSFHLTQPHMKPAFNALYCQSHQRGGASHHTQLAHCIPCDLTPLLLRWTRLAESWATRNRHAQVPGNSESDRPMVRD